MKRQRGAVLLLALLAIILAFAASWASRLPRAQMERDAANHDSMVLAQAKQALLAWSAVHCAGATDLTKVRSGELPFPDADAPGDAGYGIQDAVPGTRIGRLPWKTLGIADLTDSNGNSLWYAVHTRFKDDGPLAQPPLCTGPADSLTVYGPDGTTRLNPSGCVMAVVLVAGPSLGSQQRHSIGLQRQVKNYLETGSVGGRLFNHQLADGPFIDGPAGAINDRLITVSFSELKRTSKLLPCLP
ncbi:hypothetical protein ACTSKR_15555 [Chitinibacteraceae bacterium HSL-7]